MYGKLQIGFYVMQVSTDIINATIVFCDAAKVARIFDKSWMGRPVYFISTLTLEVYMVQYALFTDRFNDIFPWNILLTYIVIFLIAYFLKCSSNLFSLLFKEDRITWEKVCQV